MKVIIWIFLSFFSARAKVISEKVYSSKILFNGLDSIIKKIGGYLMCLFAIVKNGACRFGQWVDGTFNIWPIFKVYFVISFSTRLFENERKWISFLAEFSHKFFSWLIFPYVRILILIFSTLGIELYIKFQLSDTLKKNVDEINSKGGFVSRQVAL